MAWHQMRGHGQPKRPEGTADLRKDWLDYEADVIAALVEQYRTAGDQLAGALGQPRRSARTLLVLKVSELVDCVARASAEELGQR